MLVIRFVLFVFLTIFFSGCFKLGYQIEFGSQEPAASQEEPNSGYYYKPPTYYVK